MAYPYKKDPFLLDQMSIKNSFGVNQSTVVQSPIKTSTPAFVGSQNAISQPILPPKATSVATQPVTQQVATPYMPPTVANTTTTKEAAKPVIAQTPTVAPALLPHLPDATSTPPTTTVTPPATTTQSPTSIADIYAKYGLTAPTVPSATKNTSATDYISQYGLTKAEIDRNLEQQKANIMAKYDLKRQQVKSQTENERRSALSGLYSVGEVNPLSSGTSNIGAASNDILDRRIAALDAQESEEVNTAIDKAYGYKSTAAGMAQQQSKDQEAQNQQYYENQRKLLSDTLSFVQAGRQMTQEDKDNAVSSFKDLISLGGSQSFSGYTLDDYQTMDKALGYKAGTTANLISKIKSNELKGTSDIRELSDGSIVNVKTDKDGNISYDTLIKATAKATPYEFKTVDKTGYVFDPTTGQYEAVAGGGVGGVGGVGDGTGQISSEQQTAILQSKSKVQKIDEILNAENFDDAFGLLSQQISKIRPSSQLLRNQVNQLINDLVLDERGRLKGSGQISDFETKIIRQAATALGTNLDETQARKVLTDIKEKFENVEKATYLSQSLGLTQDEAALQLENLKSTIGRYPTMEEIQEEYPTFSQPLSKGLNGSVKQIASAIGQYESGGNYKAIGADTGGGNRAYGKYQVMASNIPSWTKEALGKSMTPQQFLNSPQAQDAVAEYKMGKYLQQYGTLEDVASVWFSGQPMAKAGNAKDVLGTSVPSYIKNVRSIYDNLS